MEYRNLIDPALAESMDEIHAYQAWADPPVAAIRTEWPPSTVRIALQERAVDDA